MSDQFEQPPIPEPGPDHGLAPPPPPPGPELSLGQRFGDLITAPGRAMAGVAERPAWGIPFLIIFALMAVYTMATMHITMPEQTEQMIAMYPPEMQSDAYAELESLRDPTLAKRIFQGLQSGLGVAIFALMIPALLHHLFSRLSGGEGKLKQTLGVVYWSGLVVFGLKTVLSWLVVVATGSGRWASLSTQALLPEQNPFDPVYVLASFFGDPFFYWTLWLVAVGLATVHRFSLGKGGIVVGAVHVLLSGIVLGLVLVGRMALAAIGSSS
jgi:hypothetical protein